MEAEFAEVSSKVGSFAVKSVCAPMYCGCMYRSLVSVVIQAEGELQRLVWRDEELRGELQSETSLLKKKEKQLQEGTANSAACEKKLEKLEKELELHGKDGVSVKLASAEKAVEEAREAVEAMQEQIKGKRHFTKFDCELN